MLDRFRRAEPTVDTPPRAYHPAVAATFESIARTHEERDQLSDENAELKSLLVRANRENAFLTEKFRQVEANRDFYQRHYVALHTRLADLSVDVEQLRNKIDHAVAEAKREADAMKETHRDGGEEVTLALEEAVGEKVD